MSRTASRTIRATPRSGLTNPKRTAGSANGKRLGQRISETLAHGGVQDQPVNLFQFGPDRCADLITAAADVPVASDGGTETHRELLVNVDTKIDLRHRRGGIPALP